MKAFIGVALLAAVSIANATTNGENVIYFGSGAAESGPIATTSNKSPFTIGYLNLSNTRDFVWGLDVSGEGTKLDSTWGQTNVAKQANSFNFLFGKNIGKTENSRYDASLIAGFRHKLPAALLHIWGISVMRILNQKQPMHLTMGLRLLGLIRV